MKTLPGIVCSCTIASLTLSVQRGESQTPAAACVVELSQGAYSEGDAISITELRFTNHDAGPVTARLLVELAYAGQTGQFLEQLEAPGLDNVWNVGDLRVDPGNTFDPDATSADAGSPSGWGSETMKIDIGPTSAQVRTVHRFLPPLSIAFHHFEFVVTRDGSHPGEAATMTVLKNEHIAPSNISPFAIYLRNVGGPLGLYIGVNPGPTMRWFELSESLELDTRYAVDVYWNSLEDFWMAWVDGVAAGSGAVLDSDPQIVNYFVLGSSISGQMRNTTYYVDNYYVRGSFGSFVWKLLDLGGDSTLELPGGADFDLAPWAPVTVQPGFPSGTWAIRCALEEPGTGALLGEDVVDFEIP